MRAMMLERPGTPLAERDVEPPEPGRGPAPAARPRLRRLPHRPPRPCRRAAAPEAAAGARATRSSARWCAAARAPAGSRPAPGSAFPGSAGPAASAGSAAPAARTSASGRASPATISTAATPSCAVADERYCFPIPPGYDDRPRRAAALRRPDRLPLAHGRRRRGAPRPLRLRRRGPHRRPGRAAPGAPGLRLHPRRETTTGSAFARELGAEWAGGSDERAARAAGRGDPVRAGRRARAGGAARRRQGRHRRLRRDPHVAPSPSFPTSCSGASGSSARWPT